MKRILIISIYISIGLSLNSQKINNNLLYGSWLQSEGDAGRTTQKNDSSYVTILPVTYSITTLKLRRCGKAVKTTKGFHGRILDSKFKGNWKINRDTLCVQFNQFEELYHIDQSVEDRIFLISLTSNKVIYGRKD